MHSPETKLAFFELRGQAGKLSSFQGADLILTANSRMDWPIAYYRIIQYDPSRAAISASASASAASYPHAEIEARARASGSSLPKWPVLQLVLQIVYDLSDSV